MKTKDRIIMLLQKYKNLHDNNTETEMQFLTRQTDLEDYFRVSENIAAPLYS
ncbi:MAG: hypothetical protein ABIG93_03560 [archaeon]|nr:hypothetical protein [Nanoarchaeota archaeon]